MPRGRFISLEGGEGAGKSTQTRLLATWLRGHGHEVIETREPGGSPAAEKIRQTLLGLPESDGTWDAHTECLLLYAARRQHVVDIIRPALARGAWVITDRFSDSTMAYQGYAGSVGRPAVEALDHWTMAGFKPDLTLMLDIEPEAGAARAGERARAAGQTVLDVFERRPIAFHEAVLSAFRDIAAQEPERCIVIDASATPDIVAAAIQNAVKARLEMK
ncbi:MAG: dTMP kinase [Alphaproteobacteria bacterium]|nr:dTMP kinase [Alphaproteobacteria bacterium]